MDVAAARTIDWEAMEPDWRAGVVSVLQLSKEYSVSRAAIIKHWAKEGVERDLSAKIESRVDALVTQALVTPEVTQEQRVTERRIVEANAEMLAEKIVNQRADISRARTTVQRLWAVVEAELDFPEEFDQIGEILRDQNDSGQDKLNDLYRAAIGIPQQVKNVKLLAESLKTLIELERKVLKIDTTPDPSDSAKSLGEGIVKGMSEASKSFRDDLMAELVGSDE